MNPEKVEFLRQRHRELLEKAQGKTISKAEVEEFITDCRHAGEDVYDFEDREELRSFLRHWGEFRSQHSKDLEYLDLSLLPFEGEAVVGRVRKATSSAITAGVVILILLAIVAVVAVMHGNNPIGALLAIVTPAPTSTTTPTVTSTSTPTPSETPTLLLIPTPTDTPVPTLQLEITGTICRPYEDPVDMDGNKVFLATEHFNRFGYDQSGFWVTVVNPQPGGGQIDAAQIIAFRDANDTRMHTWDECDFALKNSMREALGGDLNEVTYIEPRAERSPRKLVFIYTTPTQD
jgi:hypothetical protein